MDQPSKIQFNIKLSPSQDGKIAGHVWAKNDLALLSGELILGLDDQILTQDVDGVLCKLNKIEEIDNFSNLYIFEFDASKITLPNSKSFENISSIQLGTGAKIVYYGKESNGSNLRQGILIDSSDNNGPYIDIYNDEGNASNPRVRLGNLSGICDRDINQRIPGASENSFLSGYGLYSDNVYLKGTIIASGGMIGNISIDSLESKFTNLDTAYETAVKANSAAENIVSGKTAISISGNGLWVAGGGTNDAFWNSVNTFAGIHGYPEKKDSFFTVALLADSKDYTKNKITGTNYIAQNLTNSDSSTLTADKTSGAMLIGAGGGIYVATGPNSNNGYDNGIVINQDGISISSSGKISASVLEGEERKSTFSLDSKGINISSNGYISIENTFSNYNNGIYFGQKEDKPYIIWSKETQGTDSLLNFAVTKEGILTAQEARINGEINAKSGHIGFLSIGDINDSIVITENEMTLSKDNNKVKLSSGNINISNEIGSSLNLTGSEIIIQGPSEQGKEVFSTVISSEELCFKEGSQIIASISGKTLSITDSKISQNLYFSQSGSGGYLFTPTDSGLALTWRSN